MAPIDMSAKACVAKGTELLDKRVPGWWKRVKPEELKMASCEICMLGQLFGNDVDSLRCRDIWI